MTLTFDRLTFQLSNNEEQLENMYDIALSSLFSSPFRSIWVDLLSKLTVDLIDDLGIDQRGHFRWIFVCVLVHFNLYYSIQQHKCHFEKWHSETATIYHVTGMVYQTYSLPLVK